MKMIGKPSVRIKDKAYTMEAINSSVKYELALENEK